MVLETPQTGYVVSDLHLFTHRTDAEFQMGAMRFAAARADFFVLNGDIFDFRWSTLARPDRTARAAADWLRAFASDFPRCRFFYVMGNHDGLECFAEHLDGLAGSLGNFQWHPSHVRIGGAMFFHGDRVLHAHRPDPLYRPLLPPERTRGPALHAGYRFLVASGAHRVVSAMHSRRRCARRILRSLDEHHHGLADSLTDIYFGHIHKTFSNYRYRGVTFHNTGSTVRGLRSYILPVRT